MEKRFILYLDILGFKELISLKDPDFIYNIINDCLILNTLFKRYFSTIYFSDTVMLWQKEIASEEDDLFLNLLVYASIIFNSLVSKGIPIRGTIVYGELHVKLDSSGKYEIFYGKGLIEAYETEKEENWIGITVHPSTKDGVKRLIEDGKELNDYYRNYLIKRNDGFFLLNPFCDMKNLLIKSEINPFEKLLMDDALNALYFIYNKVICYSLAGDFSSKNSCKYRATLDFILANLGKDYFNLAIKEAEK